MALYSENDYKRLSGAPGVDSARDSGRSAFRKDYARLLHAPSFRRLQGKTQLFPGTESDFFRNRLTHSLEVAQIAVGIAERLNEAACSEEKIDLDLVAFAGIAHDLGHPPFGHNGEHALDAMMKKYGGFEGNAQTLRILACTERKLVETGPGQFSEAFGLDLTARSLAAVLKYDSPIATDRKPKSKLAKGYYASESKIVKLIKSKVAPKLGDQKFKTIECSIMDLADDIAYSTYDLEDSLHAEFVTPISLLRALFEKSEIQAAVLQKTNAALTESGHKRLNTNDDLFTAAVNIFNNLKQSTLVSEPTIPLEVRETFNAARIMRRDKEMSTNAQNRNQFTAERVGTLIASVEVKRDERFPALSRVKLTRDALLDVEILKHLNFEVVIRSPRLAIVEHRGKDIVKQLFKALTRSAGELLPEDWKERYKASEETATQHRLICDFIAGMTDRYAAEFHNALTGSGHSVFKPL